MCNERQCGKLWFVGVWRKEIKVSRMMSADCFSTWFENRVLFIYSLICAKGQLSVQSTKVEAGDTATLVRNGLLVAHVFCTGTHQVQASTSTVAHHTNERPPGTGCPGTNMPLTDRPDHQVPT